MEKPKVLIIQETLSRYNDPVFQLINEKVNLSFAYIRNTEIEKTVYTSFKIDSRKIGKFGWIKKLRRLLNQYDVIIITPMLKYINLILLPYLPRQFKLVSWSIGLYITYNRKYDLNKKPDLLDKTYESIQDHCDACIFYMSQPIDFWERNKKIDRNKYFVAHNTVKVEYDNVLLPIEKRDKYLFVGSLYRQKGLGELIEAYSIAKVKYNSLPKLYIVGKGPEEGLIQEIIREKNLSDSVVMTGAIYDEEVLKKYFLSSLLCISPKQAGLSVQKSLGYGVPFVTRPDAITGGERLDVINKVTGFLYETTEELSDLLVNAAVNPDEINKISRNARDYYSKEASPEKMAQGALDAIAYVLNKK